MTFPVSPFWFLLSLMMLSGGMVGFARKLAAWVSWLDSPTEPRKTQPQPIPLLGGVALWGALLIGVSLTGSLTAEFPLFIWLICSGSLLCLLGLVDDRFPISARRKLLLQIVFVIPVVWGAGPVRSLNFCGSSIPLGLLSVPLTVFWLVSCVNIMNLIDGLDGLAGSLGVLFSGVLSGIAFANGQPDLGWLLLMFVAVLVGFLLHNHPPARIYLGDAGSMVVGLVVGVACLQVFSTDGHHWQIGIPTILLSIPAFDTLVAIIRRVLQGQGIGQPDQAHFHHCLQLRGKSRWETLLLMCSLSGVMATLAVTAWWAQYELLPLVCCVFVLGLLIKTGTFGAYEARLLAIRLQQLGRKVKPSRKPKQLPVPVRSQSFRANEL